MKIDLALILTALAALTGLVWLLDSLLFARKRKLMQAEGAYFVTAEETAALGRLLFTPGPLINPRTVGKSPQQLAQMASIQGFVPFVDVAYQGFGESLAADVAGLQLLAAAVPELLIATSCSKNFGLYRERVGAALVIARDNRQRDIIHGRLQQLARTAYTFPPDFGAALVAKVLTEAPLRAAWQQELTAMQQRISGLRGQLALALRQRCGGGRFDYIEAHRGMFSLTALPPQAIDRLRDEFAIYVVPGGRINIAGLREEQIPRVADALLAVSG